jgi:hypothetical protein
MTYQCKYYGLFEKSSQKLKIFTFEQAEKGYFSVEIVACLLSKYSKKDDRAFSDSYVRKAMREHKMIGDDSCVRIERLKPKGMFFLTRKGARKIMDYSYKKGLIRYCGEDEMNEGLKQIISNRSVYFRLQRTCFAANKQSLF